MTPYYLRLAWLSLKKTPILSSLMVLAIAVGIGSCLTIVTIYGALSNNPMSHKNDSIAAIQLNAWGDEGGYYENNGIPVSLTYRDAKSVYDAGIAKQLVLTINSGISVSLPGSDIDVSVEETRIVTRDFFSMFEVPLIEGAVWSEESDRLGERMVVLNEALADKYYPDGGAIGQSIALEGVTHTIVGIVDEKWNMTPSVYDLYGMPFRSAPRLYIPFFQVAEKRFPVWGNTSGWQQEDIRSYQDYLNSEIVWIYAWAGFSSEQNKQDFQQFLNHYVAEQHEQGRFPLFQDALLQSPSEWLDIFSVVTEDDKLLLVISFAFLCVCLLNSVVLLLAKFSKNAPEAGVRRALGASRKSIFIQHIAESLLIAVLGASIGLLLSLAGLSGVRTLYQNYTNIAAVSGITLVGAILLALLSGLVSGMLPSFKISRTAPALYLKAE
jgi:putative ABC transport system permease protein